MTGRYPAAAVDERKEKAEPGRMSNSLISMLHSPRRGKNDTSNSRPSEQ